MRESLSLLMLYHWRRSLWNGHYLDLIKTWGTKAIFHDTYRDIKIKTGARLAIYPSWEKPEIYLWKWEKMPKGYRWF